VCTVDYLKDRNLERESKREMRGKGGKQQFLKGRE